MKIVVGTDGSEFSLKALEAACEIARGRSDVSFCIVAAYQAPPPLGPEPYALPAEYVDRLDQFVRESAEQNARRAVEFIRGKFPEASVKIDVIVELGRPAQIIVETAEDWDADLVVVGSHGRGFWRRLTLGSISDAVSHHARCAVLIAKDHKRAAKV